MVNLFQFKKEIKMTDLKQYGIYTGQGKTHEEIIYTTALIYNLANTKISNYLKNYDMSLGKLNILIAIKHHGGVDGLPQVKLSKHLILSPSNMTKMIDILEEEGFVTRSALDGDKRVNIVRITKKAHDVLDSLWDGFQNTMKELVGGLNDTKQKQLSGLLIEWFGELVG